MLIAAIATYALPTVAALYGGAGEDNKVLLWGIEESEEGAGHRRRTWKQRGMTPEQMEAAGVDPDQRRGLVAARHRQGGG